jgi:F-type H+-transporting ATPase subunit b
MESLLHSFGIEWKLLIAQAINFGILVFVLWKLVYKPILRVLDDRSEMAKEAEAKSSSIESKLDEIKALEESTLAEARKRGAEIIKQTESSAQALKVKLEKDATEAASKVIREAESKMKSEQDKIHAELKSEMKEIVASAIESTVGKYLNADAKHKLADEAAKEALKVEKFVEAK